MQHIWLPKAHKAKKKINNHLFFISSKHILSHFMFYLGFDGAGMFMILLNIVKFLVVAFICYFCSDQDRVLVL